MASRCEDIERQLLCSDVRETGEVIGSGWYGEVREADWRGTRCVTKRLHNVFASVTADQGPNNPLKDFIRACYTWSRLQHSSIVQFFGVIREEGSAPPVLVLEILPTSLRVHLQTRSAAEFPIEQKIKILHQVALGLVYLHKHKHIVHLNLSTNNILIHPDNGAAKITDIGLACPISSDKELQTGGTVVPGTPAFMPPEVFDIPLKYNERADVFSFGCIILSLLSHMWPQPLAPKTKRNGRLVPLSELERRQHLLDKIEPDTTHFRRSRLINQCLEDEADNRPDSMYIAKELADIQAQYHGPTSEEQVNALQATVRSLEESNAELRAKNEELMQAGTERVKRQSETQATSERKVEELEVPVTEHNNHPVASSGDLQLTTHVPPQDTSTKKQTTSETGKVEGIELVVMDSSRKEPVTHDQERPANPTRQLERKQDSSKPKGKVEERKQAVAVHNRPCHSSKGQLQPPSHPKKIANMMGQEEKRPTSKGKPAEVYEFSSHRQPPTQTKMQSRDSGCRKEDDTRSACDSRGAQKWSWSENVPDSVTRQKSTPSLPRRKEELYATSVTDRELKPGGKLVSKTPSITMATCVQTKLPCTGQVEFTTVQPSAPICRWNQSYPILFNKKGVLYYEFNNSYPAPIIIRGMRYACCAAYLLAQKFSGTGLEGAIQQSRDRAAAHNLCPLFGSSWRDVHDSAVEQALEAKFTQHEDLRQLLLGTKPRHIVYHIFSDNYWGDGGDGSGENRLGEMLMELRKSL